MDEVKLMKTEEPPVREKGIHVACRCGASEILATSNEPLWRGQRYFSRGYDLSVGPGNGCGFKKWLESSILEEFNEINEERNEMEQFVEELNVKIDDLQLKFQEVDGQKDDIELVEFIGDTNSKIEMMELKYASLEAQYEEMLLKYELVQADMKNLRKYL